MNIIRSDLTGSRGYNGINRKSEKKGTNNSADLGVIGNRTLRPVEKLS